MADNRQEKQDATGTSQHEANSTAGTGPERLNESIHSLSVSLNDRIETLAGQLRSKWQAGKRVPVETLGPLFDLVAQHEEQLLDLIYHEILLREEFGETPKLDDFVQRFPKHTERLQRLFAIHGAIEDDWPDEELSEASEDHSSLEPVIVAESSNDSPSDAIGITPRDSGDSDKAARWPRRSKQRAPEPPPGYELQEELGRGGMAVVFRAKQQILNRTVAIKMLLAGGVASKEMLARIQQEAQAVAQLQHPGIVQIFEVGEHHGLPWLALEYVAGGNLQEWLKGQPLPPLEACRIVEQLALAVQFAHERGIVHRDLKPANVLLTERPEHDLLSRTVAMDGSRSDRSSIQNSWIVKVSDFGLARVLGSRSDLTATGQVIGTPSYMAPEQAAGQADDATPAQDVYSLGAILFELLTGRPPFRGATLFDTLEQVRSDEPVPPRRLQPRVPRDLETICLKCLEKKPERRYATARELADDLRSVQAGESIRARPVGALEKLWKSIRRSPGYSTLILIIVLLLVTGFGGILIENNRANQREADAREQRDRAIRLSLVASRERDEAKRLRELAEMQTAAVETQRLAADAARSDAVIARQQAEDNLQQALTAIDSLARLGIELRQTPLQQATSRRILDETLRLYDQLEKSHGNSSRLRVSLASTLIRAGEIRAVLRENTRANELLTRATSVLDEELMASPDDMELLGLSAWANWVHANSLKDTGHPQDALAAYQKGLASHDAALKLMPDHASHQRDKANTLTNICAVLTTLNRAPETLPLYEESISLLRTARQKYPTDRSISSELALALHDQSQVLRAIKGKDAATPPFEEAFQIREELYQQNPKNFGNLHMYSRLFVTKGFLLQQGGDPAAAAEQFGRAVELISTVAASYPSVFEYQRDLISARGYQIDAFLAAKNLPDALPVWKSLGDQLIQVRSSFPNERQIVSRMQEWMEGLAEHLAEQGDTASAARYWRAATEGSLWLVSPAAEVADQPVTEGQRASWSNNTAWFLAVKPAEDSSIPQAEQLKKAEELASFAVRTTPDSSNYCHTLAQVYYESGRYEEAKKLLMTAIEIDRKKYPPVNGADGDAVQTANGLKPTPEHQNPQHFSLLAMTLWQLGEKDAAKEIVERLPDLSQTYSRSVPQDRRFIALAKKLVAM
ncbi:MAG: protein kinase [Planctomycetaceae bacterium]|nr:protein kinase [Planctomycetaceae bacterium]